MDGTNPIADAAARILGAVCDPQTVNSAKDASWKAPAWQALEDAGLTLAWVPEELGGAGTSLADGFEVARVAGQYAAPLPVAETLLAGWLLSRAGLSAPQGALTCGPSRERDEVALTGGTLKGRLRAVPFAGEAGYMAILARRADGGCAVALVDTKAASLKPGTNIAGDATAEVTLKDVRPVAVKDAPSGLDARSLLLMGSVVRSMQMAGALETILAMTVAYANERVAFERPIGKFQAVQHNLARLAGEAAVALSAAGSAADAINSAATFDDGVFLEAASAKIRVGEAAGEGTAIAHQVLGAIGFTREHTLHRFTRRLWAWRDDFGNESFWAAELGNMVANRGAGALWPLLAAR